MTEYGTDWVNFMDEEPEPPKPTKKPNWLKRVWTAILYAIFSSIAHGLSESIARQRHRKKHYRHVIKQGWFGEYSEWHER